MSENAIEWFSSYLSGRSQVTKIDGLDSECLEFMCAVPQGSILGPLIFILYINSLPYAIKSARTSLYADTTVIVADKLTIEKQLNLMRRVNGYTTINSH